MSLAPFLPTPLTDLGWILHPGYRFQPSDSLCAKIQLKYLDCLEAYGIRRGRDQCAELFYDVCECQTLAFQSRRVQAIRSERMKQYREGKLDRPFDEHPPLDSFVYTE